MGKHMARNAHIFYETEIEGAKFEAFMVAEGPYIHMTGRNGYTSGTALGVSTIDHFTPRPHVDLGNGDCLMGKTKSGWWIAKYGNQPTVDISCLSEAGRDLLMQRFGIRSRDTRKNENEVFRQSDAFRALCQWVTDHPRIAQRHLRGQIYLQWVEMVEESLEYEREKAGP
jgi:hypothetical protein